MASCGHSFSTRFFWPPSWLVAILRPAASRTSNSETRHSLEKHFNLLTSIFLEVIVVSFWLELPSSPLLGIPFAEPPIGDGRFSPPKPKYSLSPLQSFDARNFGLPCLQPVCPSCHFSVWKPILISRQINGNMSEDCLTINVYRPSGVGVNSSLSVMAWIHGGGFISAWMDVSACR